jgi:hypothetical protein
VYSLWEVVRISSRAQIGPGRDESVVSDERPLAYRARHDTLSLDRPRHHVAVVAGSESVIRRARDSTQHVVVHDAVRITALRAQIGPDRDESAVSDERHLAYRVHYKMLHLNRAHHNPAQFYGSESVSQRP